MEKFSAVIIARNEEKTIERLLQSLKEVEDIVVVDTGSTDKTVEIAKRNGANVFEVGAKFVEYPTEKDIQIFQERYGFNPSFTTQSKLFNYAAARNYALTLAKNDWCFQPDADEIVEWDINEVKKLIQECDHLVYRFCFAHNKDGSCGLEFSHSKFFRRSKLKWVKKVHEVHAPIEGVTVRPAVYTDKIYLQHWQIQSENRANYLPKLEYAILEEENDDRNTFYLAREYLYAAQYEKSLAMFERYHQLKNWIPEKGQAYIFMGDCHRYMGNFDKAVEFYHKAIITDATRREGFWALGSLYMEKNAYRQAAIYLKAALEIPFNPNYYLNNKDLYTEKIHDNLALVYNRLGEEEKAKEQWLLALKAKPSDMRILSNFEWFYRDNLPLISIVVPTCRPTGYERLEKSIKQNTLYKNIEIIKQDGLGNAIMKFNEGVEKSSGELIVFLADDCEVAPGWIEHAFIHFKEKFGEKGLVIFNDSHWHGTLANHFLCSKNLKEELGGEIWHSGYFHCGADDELTYRLKKKNLISYCEDAKIIHHHFYSPSKGAEKEKYDEFYALIEKNMKKDRELLASRLKTF